MSTLRKLRKPLGCKPTQQQKTHLIEHLEQNPFLIEGVMCRQKAVPWNNLAKALNALGGAQKSGDKWLKYWYDQRAYIRDRYAELRDTMQGNSIYDPYIKPRKLSNYEKRVIALSTPSLTAKTDDFLQEFEPKIEGEFIIPNVELEESQTRTHPNFQSEVDSDDSRYTRHRNITRNCTQSSDNIFPPQIFAEVNIKSECNSELSTSAIPSPEMDYSRTPNEPTPLLLTDENIKTERISEPQNSIPIPTVLPDYSSSRTKSKTKVRVSSKRIVACKSRMNRRLDREIQLKTLAAMKSNEKFNREMEIKKLEVEERKIEALNRLINVVQNGFDRIADLAQK